MILAVDVDYREWGASVAGIAFEHWKDENESGVFRSRFCSIEEYVPGEFFRRELPCILKLIQEHSLNPDIIIVDGFVHLDGKSKPGLGMHLYNALHKKVVVIGVAKKSFKDIDRNCEVFRRSSKTPLYITSVGIQLEEAKRCIKSMYGKYRIPALLKKADRVCRES